MAAVNDRGLPSGVVVALGRARAVAEKKSKLYGEHKLFAELFLQDFVVPSQKQHQPDYHRRYGHRHYMVALQDVANRKSKMIEIDLDDVEHFLNEHPAPEFLTQLQENVQTYREFFVEACVKLMPAPDSDAVGAESVHDIYARSDLIHEGDTSAAPSDDPREGMPIANKCRFDVYFTPLSSARPQSLRTINASQIGGLVTLDCVVTRVGPVRPKLCVAAYKCDKCQRKLWQVITGSSYMPLNECATPSCVKNKLSKAPMLTLKLSKLVKCQEAIVQEPSHQVPKGNVPITRKVVMVGEIVRSILPGDAITLTGVWQPKSNEGYEAVITGTMPEMYIAAEHIRQCKQGHVGADEGELQQEVLKAHRDPNIYERLAKSIAPEIYGHEDAKKALLLLLVGGTPISRQDGMKIRGDLHVLLMGDPGVAKSQLLRQVCQIAPRAVFTTGKGTSGVGLTAAVVRDPVTQEVTLEGGALVMADRGVCCIDEFDKMDENDRTAIHEVMEQQTISIAKGGITTVLNARASVLAAANPAYGRYNTDLSPVANMNLPESLLSRFDLQFLMLDKAEPEHDMQLAHHIGAVHRDGAVTRRELDFDPVSAEFMRAYVRTAKTYNPVVPAELATEVVAQYANLRTTERDTDADSRKSYTTPRMLLAMLRMSQAIARLQFKDHVERGDFLEAMRLMQASKETVYRDVTGDMTGENLVAAVYDEIRKLHVGQDGSLDMLDIERRVGTKFGNEALQTTLLEYEEIGVWTVSDDRKLLRFVQ